MDFVRRQNDTQEQLSHITEEMYKQNHELADRNKTLSILRLIDEVVLTSSSSQEASVTQLITDLLVHETDFNFVAIYLTDQRQTYASLSSVASQKPLGAVTQQTLKGQVGVISVLPHSGNTFSSVAESGQVETVSSFRTFNPSMAQETDVHLMALLSINSIFVCPLKGNNGLMGVLVLGAPHNKNELSEFLRNLVDRLSSTISIAVENYLLDKQLQQATAKLAAQNTKLKDLDQSKDEFISMASHQLRTPLTTLKGYLSMMLEGDLGKVPANQMPILEQAFDSANKMVYLIGDLLNVSRLQSGKFVIENKPTDMPQLVESEVKQLQQTAKARGVILKYDKPQSFPTINIDDNKIRQVVMNYLDNAIYYTPKGGQVTVNLQATDTAIIYTVTDSGIGVPKEVQPHLFSKFYRADNARKMRPGGTGLGLFMARKVIAAQGGSIIFKSIEGKGSTFGFSFPRQSVELKTT